jgi:lipoyl(octanoyl) transferase
MNLSGPESLTHAPALQVYLLGTLDFEAALRFQRRLHYEVSGDRRQAVLVVCEHPPLITVGRQGSRAHIHCSPEELRSRQWPVRWLNRGGGCLLHGPGQIAVYPILPLDDLGLTVPAYLDKLHQLVIALLADFNIQGITRPEFPGVYVGPRLLAAVGAAVRDWVSYFGAWINVYPYLDPFRQVRWGNAGEEPMTSLERERRGRLAPSLVRERLIEHCRMVFGFERVALFSDHPALNGCVRRSGEAVSSREK